MSSMVGVGVRGLLILATARFTLHSQATRSSEVSDGQPARDMMEFDEMLEDELTLLSSRSLRLQCRQLESAQRRGKAKWMKQKTFYAGLSKMCEAMRDQSSAKEDQAESADLRDRAMMLMALNEVTPQIFCGMVILFGYIATWWMDRQRLGYVDRKQRLEQEVICLGTMMQSFSIVRDSIMTYGELWEDRCDQFCNKMAEKHVPSFLHEQMKKRDTEKDVDGSPLTWGKKFQLVWRDLGKCEDIPEAFHKEVAHDLSMKVWVAHVRCTALSQNAIVQNQLIQNRHLLPFEDQWDVWIQQFCEQNEEYKRMNQQWEMGDYTITMPSCRFPGGLVAAVKERYEQKAHKLGIVVQRSKKKDWLGRLSKCFCGSASAKEDATPAEEQPRASSFVAERLSLAQVSPSDSRTLAADGIGTASMAYAAATPSQSSCTARSSLMQSMA